MFRRNINGINTIDTGELNKQPIFFIHAFPLCSNMWNGQIDYFYDQFRVITCDLRGFGNSKPDGFPATIDSHVEDILSIVKTLGLEDIIYCGLSMGGYILLRLTEMEMKNVSSVILCDTKSEADTNQGKINRFNQIRMIKAGRRDEYANVFINNALCKKTLEEKSDVVKFIKDMIEIQTNQGICNGLMTLAAHTDTTDSLKNIKIPSLIIVGEEDKLTTTENASSLHAKIPNSKLSIIPDSGHFPNLEKPTEFNKAITDFLNGI